MSNRLLFFFVLFNIVCTDFFAADFLFKDGKSNYAIVLQPNASESEKIAAREFQYYISRIGNVSLPIHHDGRNSGHAVYIGWNANCGGKAMLADAEGFIYRSVGHDIHIYGGSQRGTMYGVFSFLEQQFGVHWYSSSFKKVPQMKSYAIPTDLEHSESPAIRHRLDYYYDALHNDIWCAHNLLNNQCNTRTNDYGGLSAYWGMHTFHTLIPADKYFQSHPEYFSMRRGRRTSDGQLCLSNPDMRKVLTDRLKVFIKGEPDYWVYDVSQNDNDDYCQCKSCKALAKKYGGQSGVMLWFVNQVAKEIEKEYPDKMVGTFAYHYTRQAPRNIKPYKNVVIRLCNIECCRGHNMEGCKQNLDFMKDMMAWKALTNNIYIWDYHVDFNQYLAPYPMDYRILADNIKTYIKYGTIGLFCLGQYETQWGEFSELKQWLLAKLMWNPDQDVDSLTRMFMDDYYGEAAPCVWEYYQLLRGLIKPTTHYNCYIQQYDPVYTSRFIDQALPLVEKALEAAGTDAALQKRVGRVAAQVYYLRMKRNAAASKLDGTMDKFMEILHKDRTIIKEHNYSLEDMLQHDGYI